MTRLRYRANHSVLEHCLNAMWTLQSRNLATGACKRSSDISASVTFVQASPAYAERQTRLNDVYS